MSNPMETGFWQKKFKDTCGYAFKRNNKYSKMDVCNARYHYSREKDPIFPITFTKTDYSIINNTFPSTLDKDQFWSAVVSPTSAFFDGNWKNWNRKGQEFYQMLLCKIIVNSSLVENLSKKEQEEFKLHATRELIKANILREKIDEQIIIPEPIKVVEKWDENPPPTTEDVLKEWSDFNAST